MELYNPKYILYPLLGLFTLIFLVLFRIMFTRSQLVRSGKINWEFFKTFQGGELSEKAITATKNFANLFEMPVLFCVICILVYVTARFNNADVDTFVDLAWVYVALRSCHSAVHVTFNHVKTRFACYFLSNVVLVALWVLYFTSWPL